MFDAGAPGEEKAQPITFAGALDAAFNQLRQYGCGSVAVAVRMLQALTTVAYQVRRPQDAEAVARHAEMIVRAAEQQWTEQRDLEDLRRRFQECRQALRSTACASNRRSLGNQHG